MNPLLEAARRYTAAGLSVLPTHVPTPEEPGKKWPIMHLLPVEETADGPKRTWGPFKDRIAYESELLAWFEDADPEKVGIGIIAGRVSKNLEIIDIEFSDLVTSWLKNVRLMDEALSQKLVVEKAPRGGAHVFYCCRTVIGGPQKLAMGLREKDGELKETTLIETRGESSYAIVAPSKGYIPKRLSPDLVQTISPEERDMLLSAARALNEVVVECAVPDLPKPKADGQKRPGDHFNEDFATMEQVLTAWSWSKCYTNGTVSHWRRPGKEKGGISATFNHIPGKFHVFTSNASPLEMNGTYSPFALYTMLEHNGDFSKASSVLRTMGYGVLDPLANVRPVEEEPPVIDVDSLPPANRTSLALAPDLKEEEARYQPGHPDFEPGMDDPDEDEAPVALLPDPTMLIVPPEGYPHILDSDVVEYALGGEQGLGKLAARMFKNKLLFDHSTHHWFRWEGNYWTECLVGEPLEELESLRKLIISTAVRKRPKKLRVKGDKTHEQAIVNNQKIDKTELFDLLLKASQSLQKLSTCKSVLEFACSGFHGLGTSGLDWDQDMQFLLPCSNGIVNLKDGTIRPGTQTDRFKTVCPTRYVPDAQAPRWEQFIREIMPDEDTADFLRRLLGYAITGSVVEHVFPVFWGKNGRNGKDTLTETLFNIMGPMSTPVSAKTLMKQPFAVEHDSPMLDLRGRRFAWASEAEDKQALDTAKVKLWTGGGALKGRPPYGARQITFNPTHKLFLISNYKPVVPSDDTAFWRRMVLIPFPVTFTEEPTKPNEKLIDPDLKAKLTMEREGILAWLVRACIEWQAKGLMRSQVVRRATQEYHDEEDAIGEFMKRFLVTDSEGRLMGKDIFNRYVQWLEDVGEAKQAIGYKKFMKVLRGKEIETKNFGHGIEVLGFLFGDPSKLEVV